MSPFAPLMLLFFFVSLFKGAKWLVIPVVVIGGMQTVAAIDFGSGALPLTYFCIFLIIARWLITFIFVSRANLHVAHWGRYRKVILPLVFFAIYATVLTLIAPNFFENIIVAPFSDGVTINNLNILAFERSHVRQLMYLWVSVIFVAAFVATVRSAEDFKYLDVAIKASLVFLFLLGLWQVLFVCCGVPFPESLIYSNHYYKLNYRQFTAGIPRMTAYYIEPSQIAIASAGYFGYFLSSLYGTMKWSTLSFLGLSLLVCIMSFSSTAYAGIAIGCLVFCLVVTVFRRFNYQYVRFFTLISISLMFVSLLVGMFAVNGLLSEVVDSVLLSKADSVSAEYRMGVDKIAIELFEQTYGVGVGWASHRSSSFAAFLLCSVGVIGLIILMYLAMCVGGLYKEKIDNDFETHMLWGLCFVLITMFIAGADPNHPFLWFMLALALSGAVVPGSGEERYVRRV